MAKYTSIRYLIFIIGLATLIFWLLIPSSASYYTQEAEAREKSTEEIVREYFNDIPILIDVAFCESSFRQFDNGGNVLRGMINPEDIGILQINEYWHLEDSKAMGWDIYTLEGNLAYARYLYSIQGLGPWGWSKDCWGVDL